MRLGLRPTVLEPESKSWSKIRKLYGGAGTIWERHRHRYEVNPECVEKLEASGLPFIGKDEKGERMQVLELRGLYHFGLNPILVLFFFDSYSLVNQIIHFSWLCKHIPSFVHVLLIRLLPSSVS